MEIVCSLLSVNASFLRILRVFSWLLDSLLKSCAHRKQGCIMGAIEAQKMQL